VTGVAPGPPGGAGRPEVAVGAVAVGDGGLLLVRRGRDPQVGRWSVPGGRVEAGETLAEALAREVLEETGLVVRVEGFLGWVERIGPAHHFVILDFTVAVVGGELVAGGDASSVGWVPLSEVPRLPLVAGLEEFLREHGVLPGPAQP
jgi:acetyl-CoA carboxylase carboxyl transferase subunit beta